MKATILAVAALAVILVPGVALAHVHYGKHHRGPQVPPVVSPVVPPVVTPVPTPPTVPTPPVVGMNLTVYTTFYASGDNTPRGSTQIDLGGHSGNAGGTGTYANPITLAVGGSIINGKEVDDYPYGTIFYFPDLKKYFKAADFCGDGNTPQNEACHKDIDHPGVVQVDLYAGNGNFDSCEDNLTGLRQVIINPASNLPVDTTALCK